MKKVVLLAFVLVLSSLAVVERFVGPVVAEGTIYIKSDGSVVGTDKIQRDGNIYTFTDNINDSIVVERDDIVVDGAGYTLQGTGSGNGIALSRRSNVTVKNIEIEAFWHGIYLDGSSNNTISGNTVTNNYLHGIKLDSSSNYNSIYENTVTNNSDVGIMLSSSSNNVISGNNITNNDFFGIWFFESSNNSVYHNNFVNNERHVLTYNSVSFWDNGVEGNYWSNYTGVDLDHGGIGESPHVIDANNQDNFPLMGMFSSFNTSLGYNVNVISNSTIEDFRYFESNSTIKMYVPNMALNQTFGFCRVCIPKKLMSPPYTVMIDDGLTEALYFNGTVYDNGTHRWIYFAYEHSTQEVAIIPECPTCTPILLLFILLTVTIAIHKRRLLKTPIH